MHNAPGQIKKLLYLNCSRMTSFAVVKHEVIQFLRSERAFENRSSTRRSERAGKGDPMDIDEIGKGKKGKPKGGRKGGKMQHFNSWNDRWNKGGKGNKSAWSKTGKDRGTGWLGAKKGKHSPLRFVGNCNKCGTWGHRRSECWSAPAEEKGRKR